MFFDEAKKSATTILSKRKSGGGPKIIDKVPMKPEIVKTEDGAVDGRHLAAQDMMAAFHDKSPQKLMEALSNFVDIHQGQSSSE